MLDLKCFCLYLLLLFFVFLITNFRCVSPLIPLWYFSKRINNLCRVNIPMCKQCQVLGLEYLWIPFSNILVAHLHQLLFIIHSKTIQQIPVNYVIYFCLIHTPHTVKLICQVPSHLKLIALPKRISPDQLIKIFFSKQWVEQNIQEHFLKVVMVFHQRGFKPKKHILPSHKTKILGREWAASHMFNRIPNWISLRPAVQ